jgi:hypothetical protein
MYCPSFVYNRMHWRVGYLSSILTKIINLGKLESDPCRGFTSLLSTKYSVGHPMIWDILIAKESTTEFAQLYHTI